MIKDKLLIQFITQTPYKFTLKRFSTPIQNKSFSFGLLIKNIDNKEFLGATVKDLVVKSSEGKTLQLSANEEFSIKVLNPNEEVEIWWPNSVSTFLTGLIWVSCNLVPKNDEHEIETSQKDSGGAISIFNHINKWGNSSYIVSRFEFEQSRTNFLLVVLTGLIFLESTFGIKNILINTLMIFLKGLQIILLLLIDLLNKIPTK